VAVAELGKRIEISGIRLYRVGRDVALFLEMQEVLGDFRV
jgi:hypothetical protein